MRIAVITICLCATLSAQQAFEVASIKPSQDPPGSTSGIFETKGRINGKNVTLKRCIRGAYDIPESQVIGGPNWADQDRYTIEAKATVPAGDHQLMLMLQTLLADRFQLVLHTEQRTIPGYRLVVAKSGLKAPDSAPDSGSKGNSQQGRIEAVGYTMAQLALKLSEALHQPVQDATGVEGRFDVKLQWSPDEMRARQLTEVIESGPSLFTAVQEQLGLKLESAKVPAQVIVIDSATKPSEN